MPEIKFVGARLTKFNMSPQETRAIKRLWMEADFTARVATWLGVAGPETWPDGWKDADLGVEDKPVTVAAFEPSDGKLLSLKFPLNVSLASDFKLRKVTRGEQTLRLVTFCLKTSNPNAASEVERWMDTGGAAECTLTITYPKQSEIRAAEKQQQKTLEESAE